MLQSFAEFWEALLDRACTVVCISLCLDLRCDVLRLGCLRAVTGLQFPSHTLINPQLLGDLSQMGSSSAAQHWNKTCCRTELLL